ncbi:MULTISPECIES: hypothetical protein [Bacillus]|uniref:hypothetical protein n=1 Tax=Bacillus TaxID=1386 RepID=UPI000BF25A94|nr:MULTISPECIES: hypothetical protein [Bacillus]PFW05335.1 hypothetical protein COL22_23320 [Bacillus thuringiensis]QEQ20770.1 hypothetical protein F0362_29995 [Bacillus sp. BS98]
MNMIGLVVTNIIFFIVVGFLTKFFVFVFKKLFKFLLIGLLIHVIGFVLMMIGYVFYLISHYIN